MNKTLTQLDVSDNEIGEYSRDNDGQAPWVKTPEGPAALAQGLGELARAFRSCISLRDRPPRIWA